MHSVELTPGKNNRFHLWVIYKNPADFPGKTVARKHTPDGPTTEHLVWPMETLRSMFKAQGYVKLERFVQDDPVIVEVWV